MRTRLLQEAAPAGFDAHVLHAMADTAKVTPVTDRQREIARWGVLDERGRLYRVVETVGPRQFVRFLIEMRFRQFRDALPVQPELGGYGLEAVFQFRPPGAR